MIQTELEQLSRDVAKKRGCEPYKKTYHMSGGETFEDTLWLTDDSAFCFELMVSEKFILEHDFEYDYVGIYHSLDQDKIVYEYYSDHGDNEILASCVVILRAYLAKGE